MKVTADDIIRYAFCPRYYTLKGPVDFPQSKLHNNLAELMVYTFRRELEGEVKTSWKQILDKWTKIFWSDFDTDSNTDQNLFNKSQIGIKKFFNWYMNLSGSPLAIGFGLNGTIDHHQIIGEVPIILEENDGTITALFLEPISERDSLLKNSRVRYISYILNSELKIAQISNISFSLKNALIIFDLFPTSEFWKETYSHLYGVLTSMQSGITYTNLLSCEGCSVRKECGETLK